MKQYVMGNGAIALGALAAGVSVVTGYPGTPSSEIIETVSKYPTEGVHVEWSVNEKAALEVAAAASYAGARTLVTMKQVGLNVAADPLLSLAYVGVKGGMVIVSADDPGPISSQTEQDTRRFADFARIPVFDPISPEDAYEMIQEAYAYSEEYGTPVLFRPTTRVCHAYADITVPETFSPKVAEGFIKDPKKWVIFPRLSFENHAKIEKRNPEIGARLSSGQFNRASGKRSDKAVVASGVSYAYAMEFLKDLPEVHLLRIGTAYPFPEDLIRNELSETADVLVLEELSPYIEEQLLKTAGRRHLPMNVHGKLDGTCPASGEYTADSVRKMLCGFLGLPDETAGLGLSDLPALPVRPPVLCAGCPHRASFYAVKLAMKGRKAVFCGDIGCYTLGNAAPLDMCDTCLCMGAGITMSQGFHWTGRDTVCFSFIGDSTFFASGMTGVVNAVYNNADTVICVLDNSTTAMTGHQPHPGTGRNMMGQIVDKVSIESVLSGIGVKKIVTVNPLELDTAVSAVRECADLPGVKAIIFKSPCVAITKPLGKCTIGSSCINCKKCIREIGCPAIVLTEGRVTIDSNLCTGCGLCQQVCPVHAIGGESHE